MFPDAEDACCLLAKLIKQWGMAHTMMYASLDGVPQYTKGYYDPPGSLRSDMYACIVSKVVCVTNQAAFGKGKEVAGRVGTRGC